MANSNPIRFGSNSENQNPLPSDLWLPLFGGELLAARDENIFVKGLLNHKTITSGTTLKFPRSWKMSAERHAAGVEMLGLPLDMGEISISVDDRPIVSHAEFDDIDLKMSHFEIRAETAKQMAQALNREEDKNCIALLINAARVPQPANGPFMGGGMDGNGAPYADNALAADNVPSSATSRGAAGAFIKAVQAATLRFMEIDVPETERYALIRPQLWMALREFGVPISAAEMYGAGATAGPFWQQPGARGPGISDPVMRTMPLDLNGWKVYQSPFIPSTVVNTGEAKYQGDFTKTLGILWQRDAVAYLSLGGGHTETFRDVRRQSDFLVHSILSGGGALRPESAIELSTV